MEKQVKSQKQSISVTRRMALPLDKVISLIEDLSRAHEWNPLLTYVAMESDTTKSTGDRFDWQAMFVGIPIAGSSVITKWEPGKSYEWLNEERVTRLQMVGRLNIEDAGDEEVEVTATLQFELPETLARLADRGGIKSHLREAVDSALYTIEHLAQAGV